MFNIRTKDLETLGHVKMLLALDGISWEPHPNAKNEIFVDASEPKLRLRIQEYFDNNGIPLDTKWVLVDGNSVYSFTKIAKEVRKVRKTNSTAKITKYFYNFMHLNFTIAHFNIYGWREQYPTWDDIMQIGLSAPHWKTDVNRILEQCFLIEEEA
jgi:hypothetical protein